MWEEGDKFLTATEQEVSGKRLDKESETQENNDDIVESDDEDGVTAMSATTNETFEADQVSIGLTNSQLRGSQVVQVANSVNVAAVTEAATSTPVANTVDSDQEAEEPLVIYSGLLEKRGHFRSQWKSRW